MRVYRVLSTIVMVYLGMVFSATEESESFRLLILHTNDMHSRFEEINGLGGNCVRNGNNRCYGGFSRLAQAVNDIRSSSHDPVLFLNAGDTYQGSVWYTVYKWKIVADLIKNLGIDAMSLGNHEFDDGVEGLAPFLKNIDIPVVSANINFTMEETLLGEIHPSVEINVNGTTVGVIGYLTPETKDIARPGKNILFMPEAESVAKEASRLRNKGVKILIALGHSGYQTDLEIARRVPDIDLVIGGHTNTFLYTGNPPDAEIPVDVYPTIVVQESGRKVPVVQAYAYTKYLGYLHLTFDEEGEIIHYEGNPILLDDEIPEDELLFNKLEVWRPNVTALMKETIGCTRVFLDGSTKMCRRVECNMGNLVADSMVHYNFEKYSGKWWTDGAISMVNGGGIRNSIDIAAGAVTKADVTSVLPFQNMVFLVEITGKHLLKILEHSASFHNESGEIHGGGFLQVSGIYARYNMSKSVGNRVLEVKVRCASCLVPTLEDIKPEMPYFILMPEYLMNGGDGFSIIEREKISATSLAMTDTNILANYIHKRSPLSQGIEWRIQIFYGKRNYNTEDSGDMEQFEKGDANSLNKQIYIFLIYFSFWLFLKSILLERHDI